MIKNLSELKPYKSLLLARIQSSVLVKGIVDDLLEGRYNNPVRVIVFDPAERSSRDVSNREWRLWFNRQETSIFSLEEPFR